MNVTPLTVPDVLLLKPRVFGDERGFFLESYNKNRFDAIVGEPVTFVQDNHSRSSRGVLRGLHYQLPPNAQGKLVRVTAGEVMDVAVDIRRHSATFGHWVAATLSAANQHQLWIPPGFAHGFMALSDSADFLYKTTGFYAPESERTIIWNDPDIGIEWPGTISAILSERDERAPKLVGAEIFA